MLPSMKVDNQSETWLAVLAFIAEEKSSAMSQLKNPKNDLATTQFYRGVVANLDELEALANPPIQTPVVDAPVSYEPGSV